MPEAEIKRLMKTLGESINHTIAESSRINDLIEEIRNTGYDVFLVIEATIGVNRKGKGDNETISPVIKTEEPVRLRITPEDAKFLKSLKIAIDSE